MFSTPGAMLMNPGTASPAATQQSPSGMEMAATDAAPAAKCFKRRAHRAEETPEYPLNPVVGEGCTVEIATIRSQ